LVDKQGQANTLERERERERERALLSFEGKREGSELSFPFYTILNILF
jgi:hypothetical protein